MSDLFYRIGLSYTRPTDTLDKADPEKQDAFRRQFEDLKKLLSGGIDVMLFEDESMIRDYQAIMKTWFPVGKRRIIPTYGKHEGVKLVGFLDYETGSVYVEEHEKYDAEVFLGFLKTVLQKHPSGKIVMILDKQKYITQSCCRIFWKKTVNAWSLSSCRHTVQTLTKSKNCGAGLKIP